MTLKWCTGEPDEASKDRTPTKQVQVETDNITSPDQRSQKRYSSHGNQQQPSSQEGNQSKAKSITEKIGVISVEIPKHIEGFECPLQESISAEIVTDMVISVAYATRRKNLLKREGF